jgi:hypothetical protein
MYRNQNALPTKRIAEKRIGRQNIPGQNISGQNISGQNISGQNVSAKKIYRQAKPSAIHNIPTEKINPPTKIIKICTEPSSGQFWN